VPTMYGDAVGLDARSGFELWRHHGNAGPLHSVHYRGRGYGEGKKIGWRDGMAALWAIARYRFVD